MASTTPSSQDSGSLGYVMTNLNVALICVTSAVFTTRLCVRGFVTKALGLDDFIACLGFALTISLSALEISEVANGTGTHMDQLSPEQINAFFSRLPVLQLVFFFATGAVRMSILAFLPRLNRDRGYMRCVYAVGFLITIITLASVIFFLAECKYVPDLFNPTDPTRQCISKDKEAYMMWTHSIVGVVIDTCLLALPIWVIWSKMKFSAKAMQVILVFCVGIFAVLTGVIRLGFMINTDFSVDTTYKMVIVTPWTDLEPHIGLICGSFPALQPVLRFISMKLGFRSTLSSTRAKSSKTGKKSGRSGNLSAAWAKSQGYHRSNSSSGVGGRDDESSSGRAIVIASPSGDDLELGAVEGGHHRIHLKTDVHVQIHDAGRNSKHGGPQNSWMAV